MNEIEALKKYFPELSEGQITQFQTLMRLYPEWNAKINVISRKDIDNLFVNHILHSLSIAKFLGPLEAGTRFLDLGTGGGFPGLPLAVMYPSCSFHLVDRIAKKLRVAADIAQQAGVVNVTFHHGDILEVHDKYNYVVSRAVMPLDNIVKLVRRNIDKLSPTNNRYKNGIICLKGGDLEAESKGINLPVIEYEVTEFFSEPFFATKKLVYIPC